MVSSAEILAAFREVSNTKQLDRAKGLAPGAATYLDYRRLLEDKSIDAIVIATPPFSVNLTALPARLSST